MNRLCALLFLLCFPVFATIQVNGQNAGSLDTSFDPNVTGTESFVTPSEASDLDTVGSQVRTRVSHTL